jgi:isochorismate hydrolase
MNDWKRLITNLNRQDWKPHMNRAAVLLIDCQEYFRGLLAPILDNITEVIRAAREAQIPLFFTQHGHSSDEGPNMLGAWWADIIMKDTPEAQLVPELGITKSDTIIPKNTYSAFHKTHLEKQLRDMGIQDLILGGVMTNLCCETSARDAFVRNFRVFFLADGTSTTDPDFHLATLRNLSFGFATLITCDQLVKTQQM